ncbi:MAG TPA: right-handed parallel beta-helix repeat-containing protein, partial [Candidatus Pacearchaeota archaeon]|nr:right-handed parallel beta-helix repeat-containing protein [Candidatus Pacearchaeota archaeon]
NIVEGNFSNPVNNKHGIYLYEAGNSTIFNNYINIQSSHPIDVRHSSIYINITKNTVISNSGPVVYLAGSKNSIIENNTVIANGSAGLYLLSSSDNCTLINNNVSNIGKGGDGIYIVNSNDVFVVNNTVTGKYARAVNLYRSLNTIILNQVAYGGDDGLEIWGSNNSIIKDCINLSGNVDDVFISSSYGLSVNNTFINCSYDINKETVNGEENELIRKWYYQAYTNYSNGTAVAGANVTAYNSSGDIQFTTLTNPSGLIDRQEVTEYVNRGGTRSYYNNYTINATLFGHETESNIFNFTTTQNKLDDVFTFNPLVPGENACGVLDSPNTVYTLTRNVLSQGTCFTIAADNITLDCNAAWINYSINGENGTYGIYSDRFNTTIKSCKVIDMNHTSPNNERYGVYFSGASNGNIEYVYVNTTNSQAIFVSSNSTNINLINNDAESLNHGIELRGSSKNNLINNTGIGLMSLSAGIVINGSNENTLINNTGIGNYSGILLGDKSSNNNILINNTATSNFSTALLISYSNNNYFISQNATSYNLGGDSVAIRISNSNNSLIKDCLSISGEDYDVYIGDNNVNNTFLNCSYDINKEYLGIRGNLIRKWYYQTYVNYTNGTAVAGANITAYNKAGQIQFTHLTDSLGYIPLKELTDYIGYNGIRNYYSNYSINASKWLYNMESNVFNFTTKGNFVEDFLTLELDTFPPSYGYVGHSSTTAGQKSKFSIKFTDRGALHPYGVYIFSTNNTGTWENDSAVNFTSTPSWANVSVTLNSTVGDVVGYRWYFSDSFGNMNMTPIYKLVTEEKEESGGEGTGGGGGKKETPSQENEDSLYRPSYEVLQRGYETYFRKGDIVQINLSKNGTYLFEIGDINRFTKNLTILFNSGKYPVGLNESLKFDLNNDSFYDLQISVRDITASNSSRINFKEINEEIPASNKPALNQTSLGNKSTINIFGINGEEKESKSVVYFVFVGIIVLALILVACAIFFRFRKAKETSVNL